MLSCIWWIMVIYRTICRLIRLYTVFIVVRVWDKILQHLVEVTRKKAGKNPNPTYAVIDSQSVDTAEQVGFDGGKKTTGISAIS